MFPNDCLPSRMKRGDGFCRYRTESLHYGLAFLRVRGIERVRLHADLTMLGRLALALTRVRTVPGRGIASGR